VDEIALLEGFYGLEESFWLRTMIGGDGPCPFFSYTLEFVLQLKKNTENTWRPVINMLKRSSGERMEKKVKQR
jgi:hypothetical protein